MSELNQNLIIRPDAESKLKKLINLKELQKLQDLFADIIHATIAVIDLNGQPVTQISQKAGRFDRLFLNKKLFSQYLLDCYQKGLKQFLETQDEILDCHLGLKLLFIPVTGEENEVLGFIVIGPVILGKRRLSVDSDNDDLALLGMDAKKVFEEFKTIQVFSYKSIDSIKLLLRDALHYMIELETQRSKLENLLPGFLEYFSEKSDRFSEVYENKLLNSLMELCFAISKADTGSVLLYNYQEQKWQMKLAYGLSDHLENKYSTQITSELADHVRKTGKALLLRNDTQHDSVQGFLKRGEIVSSMVVPLSNKRHFVGVCCLTSFDSENKFDTKTLGLIERLGELSSAALSSLSFS